MNWKLMLRDVAAVIAIFGIPAAVIGALVLFFRAIGEEASRWILGTCFFSGLALFYGVLLFKIGQALFRRYRNDKR